MGDAALAAVGDADLLFRAGVAGEGDDVHQGLFKVLLVRGRVPDALAQGLPGGAGAEIHAQGQLDPGGHHRPLQKHVVAVPGDLAGDDAVGDAVNAVVVPGIGKTGDLRENVAPRVVDDAVYASHVSSCASVFPDAVIFPPETGVPSLMADIIIPGLCERINNLPLSKREKRRPRPHRFPGVFPEKCPKPPERKNFHAPLTPPERGKAGTVLRRSPPFEGERRIHTGA